MFLKVGNCPLSSTPKRSFSSTDHLNRFENRGTVKKGVKLRRSKNWKMVRTWRTRPQATACTPAMSRKQLLSEFQNRRKYFGPLARKRMGRFAFCCKPTASTSACTKHTKAQVATPQYGRWHDASTLNDTLPRIRFGIRWESGPGPPRTADHIQRSLRKRRENDRTRCPLRNVCFRRNKLIRFVLG